jgi:hypothetical protein
MGNRGPGKDGNGFGGKYTRKAENLTKKELKAASGAKAAAKRTVSISDTKRAYGTGKTLGPGGKPLTGSVRLENGNMAVYKNGKRVVKAKPAPKPAAAPRTVSRTTTTTTTSDKPKRTDKPKGYPGGGDLGAKAPKPGEYQAGRGQTSRRTATPASSRGQVPSTTRTYANGASSSPSAAAQSRAEALGLNPATGGTRAPARPYASGVTPKSKPKPKATTSPNKRGGERRSPETQARDTARKAVKKLSR